VWIPSLPWSVAVQSGTGSVYQTGERKAKAWYPFFRGFVMALAGRIEILKLKHPRSGEFIESAYNRFLVDDSQKDESDFFDLLRRDVELRNQPEFTGKGLPKGRSGPVRRQRR